ncbi:MAG: AAA family ATPase, partial [Pseudomonadota bacterium]|nr:AAA family ATPase [Pseudomonadota bacterium]
PKPIAVKYLRKRCNPKQFNFSSTDELKIDEDIIGQERAVEAMQFGLDAELQGFNIYVMGPPGVGKHTLTKKLVIRKSRLLSLAQDWCYVYNFVNPLRPKVLKLPPGIGNQIRDDMDQLIETLHISFSEDIAETSIRSLQEKYTAEDNLVAHLEDVLNNIKKNAPDFFNKQREPVTLFDQPHLELPPYSRLKVNVFVDNSKTIGRPVIFEDNPIYHNLTGRVENMSINGSLVSDFTLIRPGSLHRANNGYLVLDVYDVLSQHLAWEGVKRALHSRQIHIQPLEQSIEFWSSQTLDPEPIPLDVKVVLIGDRESYYLLCDEEPDFKDLFKVIADFDIELPRTKSNCLRFAKMISSITKEEGLKPLDRGAVAEVIDYSSRIVEDSEKLSTRLHSIKSIIQQADYIATQENRRIIKDIHIREAIEKHDYRLSRIQEKIYSDIQRNFVSIDTEGTRVGQINSLTVLEEGDYEFGQPSRITATIHVGDGNIIDIQREIDMAGSIYSKGTLILTGYLKGRYALTEKLALSASIAFEQLYDPLEGDSASSSELAALLSSLAHIPIKQYLAVTGSVNQFGEIQAVDGVNAKIEGFYAICKLRGLTGKQGVVIPAVNKVNLMLNDEVVDAASKGLFHIYTVKHIDELMTLLTDIPAGKRDSKGQFTKDSINARIEYALLNYAQCLKRRRLPYRPKKSP